MLDNIRVVLSHTSHPGNIGAAARAMKTMGLSNLFLVNPKLFPDATANAMAAGADDLLANAVVCDSLEQALQGAVLVVGLTARQRGLSHAMLNLREAAPQILARAGDAPVVVLFGTEMSGLSNAELEKCQLLITIPVNPEFSSLNLAAAVQVVSYELRTCGIVTAPISKDFPLASFEDVERFYEHLERTLIEINFLDPLHPKRLMTRFRRLFARAQLEQEEVNILRGFLKWSGRGRIPKDNS
ncbi:MAG: RNA methyltransferase [Sulfuricella sp.]